MFLICDVIKLKLSTSLEILSGTNCIEGNGKAIVLAVGDHSQKGIIRRTVDNAQENNKTPLKYIGGYIEWTLPLTIYGDNHPFAILDNHGYPDPWLSEDDIKKSGVMIIDRTPDKVEFYTKLSCPYLPEDYKVEPVNYKFKVYNAFNQPFFAGNVVCGPNRRQIRC